MGKASRDKGARFEREVVDHLCQHGILASRVPLSGMIDGYADDVLMRLSPKTEMRIECKRRAKLPAYLTGWLDKSMDGIVAMREDRGRMIWVLSDEMALWLFQAVQSLEADLDEE